jgi:hypothetical protein
MSKSQNGNSDKKRNAISVVSNTCHSAQNKKQKLRQAINQYTESVCSSEKITPSNPKKTPKDKNRESRSSLQKTTHPSVENDSINVQATTDISDSLSVVAVLDEVPMDVSFTPKFSDAQGVVFVTFCKTSYIIGNCNQVIEKAVKALDISMSM